MEAKYELYAASEAFYNSLMEQEAERVKSEAERVKSFPIQLSTVEFTEEEMKSHNISPTGRGDFKRLVDRETGEPIAQELLVVRENKVYDTLKSVNGGNRYSVIRIAMEYRFTEEEMKKYEYLTGEFRYFYTYAVFDRESKSIVWKAEKMFADRPTVINNVLRTEKEFIFLPTLEKIHEKDYRPVLYSENYILIEDKPYESVFVINSKTGDTQEIM